MTEQDPRAGPNEPDIDPDEVRAALAEIQVCAPFVASRQLNAFLSYVVGKALAGESDRIKAYSIATEALGRPETFDPASDPIVRVEAGRLRKALDAYYQAEGIGAAIRIAVPRGSYVPRFERIDVQAPQADLSDVAAATEGEDEAPATPHATPAAAGKPRHLRLVAALGVLAVLVAFGLSSSPRLPAELARAQASIGETASASRPSAIARLPATKPEAPRIFVAPFAVTDEMSVGVSGSQFSTMLATAMARFDEVTVVTRPDGDADYKVSGRLSSGETGISVSTMLTSRATGRVIWSSQATLPRNPILPSRTINELSGSIATALAQPYGVVLSDRLARSDLPDDGFPCVIRSFNYWQSYTPKAHDEVRACLEELTRRFPAYALSYAQLAMLYLSEDEVAADPALHRASIDRAVKASALAVQLAPTSARAMQSLQYTYYSNGQLQRAIEAGNRAMLLNPLDTDIRASQGQVLIVAGRYQLGQRLIEEAASNNTAYPPWYDLYLALAAFQGGKTEALRTLMGRVDLPDHPLAALLEIIAASNGAAREAAAARMRARYPAMAADPAMVLARVVPNPELVDKLVTAARRAGLQS
ncbi:hypothetical protein OSH10_18965 [Kaistia defluvii]|uniref:hypothetical protein n=1 Tax=Kaistia defluvii TaxID=410841 RepID=UPI00224F21A9|nr:hypothetical protein [Kaistia defluvii]MCX5520524.1 hypothetical protein [Kaistia defluvii]